jgi:sulfonate transport system permease protein
VRPASRLAATRGSPRNGGGHGTIPSFLGLIPLLLLLVVWQLLGSPTSISFPTPSTWFTSIGAMYRAGTLGPALLDTLGAFVSSLAVTVVVGVILGIVTGGSRRIDRALRPLFDFFRTLPAPAIVPAVGLLIGSSLSAGIVVVVIASVWPILLNTAAAMRSLPQVRLEMSRTLGLSRWERLAKIILPSLVPGVVLGTRIAVSIVLIVTLLAEILGLGSSGGVGMLFLQQQSTFDGSAVWALLLIVGVFGYLVNVLLSYAEGRLLRNWPGRRN